MPRARRHPRLNLLRDVRSARVETSRLKRVLIGAELIVTGMLACYGIILAMGFFAVRFHATDVAGTVDQYNTAFQELAVTTSLTSIPAEALHLPSVETADASAARMAAAVDRCQMDVIRRTYPINGQRILAASEAGAPHEVLTKMVFAVRLRSGDTALTEALAACTTRPEAPPTVALSTHETNAFPWANSEEWAVIQAAFAKDKTVIANAATTTGVEARLIMSVGFVEQMRLYFTEREIFEKIFRPLKILGNATQFAWGVMAIKEAAAIDVERHLSDPRSVYYLGAAREHALDFTTSEVAKERFARLTNERDHRYSYLYGGFELAQFIAQWQRAGYPIDHRPEILATLYNIGFGRSIPKAQPDVGGSTLTIAGQPYTFGSLAFEMYYSGELRDDFPYPAAVQ